MQIHKFYHYVGIDNGLECFEGRWHWNMDFEQVSPDEYKQRFEWTDLFGKHEKKLFTFNASGFVNNVVPLTFNLVLIKCSGYLSILPGWRALELNWSNGTCQLGTESFGGHDYFYHRPVIDRSESNSNGDVKFLFYTPFHRQYASLHCVIDFRQQRIQTIGAPFQLSRDLFNCVDLKGHLISGLSTSLDKITIFDLDTRQILTSIAVHGLPSSIYLNTEFKPTFPPCAWTSTHLYVWSEESKLEEHVNSTIYAVNLETGIAKPLSYKFDGQIQRLRIGTSDELCVRVDKVVRKDPPSPDCSMKLRQSKITNDYTFFRIPTRKPESLTLLSIAAIQIPRPAIVEQILNKRDEIPKEVQCCELL